MESVLFERVSGNDSGSAGIGEDGEVIAARQRTIRERASPVEHLLGRVGAQDAGPIERCDTGTVKRHLDAMDRCCPELLPLYRQLGLLTADVAARKNPRAADRLEPVRKVLSKE